MSSYEGRQYKSRWPAANVRLQPDLFAAIKDAAELRDVPVADVIREALLRVFQKGF
jgi:hypothetical protein